MQSPAASMVSVRVMELRERDRHEAERIAAERHRPRQAARFLHAVAGRGTAWVLVLLITAAAASGGLLLRSRSSSQLESLRSELATAQAQLADVPAAQAVRISNLQTKMASLQGRIAELEAAKVKTVVETKVVTKEVPRWVPNGKAVTVETTGFATMIKIHDVQLTHAYGYSDLIGIATNESGRTISYVQLGCTFLDADGRILANEIVNRQSWAPGQTWGFDCSGQVDAVGGILRVDEMS
jgi:hypothetical protein